MPRHIWVNGDRLERGRATRVIDGIELTVEVSPYSLPKAVVGKYDKKKGIFTIEFKYIDDELPSKKPRTIGGVMIAEGKYSHKIISISIPVDKPEMNNVGVISLRTKIVEAFNERVRDVVDPDSPDAPDVLNQEIAEEILDDATLRELAGEFVK